MKQYLVIAYVVSLLCGFSFFIPVKSVFADDDCDVVAFEPEGNRMIMTGYIDETVILKLLRVVTKNPDITTIIMQDVCGSEDSVATIEAARMVRLLGLNTVVAADSYIASGGTDFFLAGVNRKVESGAMIGVHAWGGEGYEDAAKLPKNHPDHEIFLDYYEDIGIPTDFYWYTLLAAPAEDIHWMTLKEQKKFKVFTQ